jgi:hypothetical protein
VRLSAWYLGRRADWFRFEDPNTGMRVIGDAVGRSMIRAYTAMKQKVPLITDEVLHAYKEELGRPGRAYYFPIYAAAAQRR